MVGLNANENGGFESLCKWWLLKALKMVALNAYENGGSKCLCKW